PRREAGQASGPLLPAGGDERPVRGRRCRSPPGARGPRSGRSDDRIGAGRRGVRRVANRAISRGGPARARPGTRARRVPRRRELQHRDRVRVHRPELDQCHELRLRHHRGGRGVPRDPRGPGRRDARGWRRGAPRPDGRQAARAMQLALADARVAPVEVGYINAHGSSTPLNDTTETAAIKQVFGDHAYRLSVSGTKGYYGHALGASGAIEAAICALAMERRWLPPTINLEHPDPACDLDCLRGDGRAAAPEVVLTNSFGFGGINAAVVLRRPD